MKKILISYEYDLMLMVTRYERKTELIEEAEHFFEKHPAVTDYIKAWRAESFDKMTTQLSPYIKIEGAVKDKIKGMIMSDEFLRTTKAIVYYELIKDVSGWVALIRDETVSGVVINVDSRSQGGHIVDGPDKADIIRMFDEINAMIYA